MTITAQERSRIGSTLEQIVGVAHLSDAEHDGARGFLVRPGSAAEVSEIVGKARELSVAIIPVGKGGRPAAGSMAPDRCNIFVDMSRMDHVLHLDETSQVVHVQAGLAGVALEEILSKRGLTIGDFPPAALGSTIGGLLAVRTPGKSSRRHGTLEDIVLGLSAVLPDGRMVHTRVAPRRATGPDLARTLCGSEGTLGIITSAVLRIHRRPESRLLASYRLPDMEQAFKAVRLALREEASPAAMRIYDAAEARALLGEDVGGGALLVAATAGATSLAACDRDLISSAVEAVGGESLGERPAATWWRRRTGHEPVEESARPNLQISATQSRLSPVYHAIAALAREEGFEIRAHASRFAADGGVLFFTLADDHGRLPDTHAALQKCAEHGAREGGVPLGATSTRLHSYFESLRDALDPFRQLNPSIEI